jgi:hypothetical protein
MSHLPKDGVTTGTDTLATHDNKEFATHDRGSTILAANLVEGLSDSSTSTEAQKPIQISKNTLHDFIQDQFEQQQSEDESSHGVNPNTQNSSDNQLQYRQVDLSSVISQIVEIKPSTIDLSAELQSKISQLSFGEDRSK